MHDRVDLRSDTVTKPTPAMRRAMAGAEVGDDVLGDDPTVLKLEEMAAQMLGKEAALFVPSGTMANNVAIKVHTQPGEEILLDWHAHSLCYEVGAPAALSGVLTRPFRSRRGVPDVDDVAAAITPRSLHSPGTVLLVLENTHNRAGGAVIPLNVHRALYERAKNRGLNVHLDGARLFNAAVATGVPAGDYAAQADSVSFCLSKGLGCPVGSLLCGTREFVEKARRVRKMFGGGMRQAGVLAACGIVALETGIDRLADDHRNARRLAEGIAGLPGMRVDLESVQTNMVYLDTDLPAAEVVRRLGEQRVLCLAVGLNTIRLVTHLDVDEQDMEAAIAAFRRAAATT
jgi:threonine aldolase